MLMFNTYNTLNLKEKIYSFNQDYEMDTSLSSLSLQMFIKFYSLLEVVA